MPKSNEDQTCYQGVPNWLKHKPFFALPYQHYDGYNADNTDTYFLSIGLAQWNAEEVSIKTWRHTGGKWSRQSEEIPLYRIIDMTIMLLLLISQYDENKLQRLNGINISVDPNTFFNQDEEIEIRQEKERSHSEKLCFADFFSETPSNPEYKDNPPYLILKNRFGALFETLLKNPKMVEILKERISDNHRAVQLLSDIHQELLK